MTDCPLRIAVVSDAGSDGGAGIAATRLARGLTQRGHEVVLIHRADFRADPDAATMVLPVRHDWAWWGRLMAVARTEPVRRAVQRSWARAIGRALDRFRPHVISLHNLHRAEWDVEVVEACLHRAPVAWTLHDMWALTGGCAYAYDCRRFEVRCTWRCPQAGSPPTPPARMVGSSFRRRERLFAGPWRLVLVPPSRWLAREARLATDSRVEVRTIPHGLDLEVFRPRDRGSVRNLLGLGDDPLRPWVATAAASFGDPRKGLQALLDALALLPEQEVGLLLLGAGGRVEAPAHVELARLGPVAGDALLALVHSCADLFVLPSAAENQPLVVLEAMASAVPVVGAAVGGVPELVIPGTTGWLADAPTASELAGALRIAFAERDRWPEVGASARSFMEAQHSLEQHLDRYSAVLKALASGRAGPSQDELDAVWTAPAG